MIVDQGLPPPKPVHTEPLYPSQVVKSVLYLKPPRGPSKWEKKKPTFPAPPIERNPSA